MQKEKPPIALISMIRDHLQQAQSLLQGASALEETFGEDLRAARTALKSTIGSMEKVEKRLLASLGVPDNYAKSLSLRVTDPARDAWVWVKIFSITLFLMALVVLFVLIVSSSIPDLPPYSIGLGSLRPLEEDLQRNERTDPGRG